MKTIDDHYFYILKSHSDINEHMETLYNYAKSCTHITELGIRSIHSSWGFLKGFIESDNNHPKQLVNIDNLYFKDITKLRELCNQNNIKYNVINHIEPTDLLFIDLNNNFNIKNNLDESHHKIRKYIVFHNLQKKQIIIDDFLLKHREWKIKEIYKNNNGLIILERSHWNQHSRNSLCRIM